MDYKSSQPRDGLPIPPPDYKTKIRVIFQIKKNFFKKKGGRGD
jgi:hypothetical protein